MATPTDQELVAAAQAGDRVALERLLERHQGQIYRFGLKMCRHPEDAKDVVQETLFAVARGVGNFRGASSVSTWLYSIARSFCIKQRRRSKFAPDEERSLERAIEGREPLPADSAELADEQLATLELQQALDDAIGRLEPMYREVLVLRDVQGLTAPEVAEVMGLSVDAVKSRLHRARLAVRERLVPLLQGPPLATEERGPAEGCPDVLLLFSRHQEGEISAELCGELERHLAGCPRCRAACDTLRQTLALCRTAPAGEMPEEARRSVQTAIDGFWAAREGR
ncbi:MAG: sigma-70 family RNA polymerase sigma factor [Deltaproteobacteria bacterium]|nr:sigma-70 family RNA polymerase sigma factor [Deltaproteobacteria bacterium]